MESSAKDLRKIIKNLETQIESLLDKNRKCEKELERQLNKNVELKSDVKKLKDKHANKRASVLKRSHSVAIDGNDARLNGLPDLYQFAQKYETTIAELKRKNEKLTQDNAEYDRIILEQSEELQELLKQQQETAYLPDYKSMYEQTDKENTMLKIKLDEIRENLWKKDYELGKLLENVSVQNENAFKAIKWKHLEEVQLLKEKLGKLENCQYRNG